MHWTRVGATGDFQEGKGRTLRVWGRRVAIIRYGDQLFALDAVCPHSGAYLGLGRVKDGRVICPDHGWTFDLGTGCMPGANEIAVGIFPVKVDEGSVFIAFPSPEDRPERHS